LGRTKLIDSTELFFLTWPAVATSRTRPGRSLILADAAAVSGYEAFFALLCAAHRFFCAALILARASADIVLAFF
jgi:hypothetical protein